MTSNKASLADAYHVLRDNTPDLFVHKVINNVSVRSLKHTGAAKVQVQENAMLVTKMVNSDKLVSVQYRMFKAGTLVSGESSQAAGEYRPFGIARLELAREADFGKYILFPRWCSVQRLDNWIVTCQLDDLPWLAQQLELSFDMLNFTTYKIVKSIGQLVNKLIERAQLYFSSSGQASQVLDQSASVSDRPSRSRKRKPDQDGLRPGTTIGSMSSTSIVSANTSGTMPRLANSARNMLQSMMGASSGGGGGGGGGGDDDFGDAYHKIHKISGRTGGGMPDGAREAHTEYMREHFWSYPQKDDSWIQLDYGDPAGDERHMIDVKFVMHISWIGYNYTRNVAPTAMIRCTADDVVLTDSHNGLQVTMDVHCIDAQFVFGSTVRYGNKTCTLGEIEDPDINLFNKFGRMLWFTNQPDGDSLTWARTITKSYRMATLLAHLYDLQMDLAAKRDPVISTDSHIAASRTANRKSVNGLNNNIDQVTVHESWHMQPYTHNVDDGAQIRCRPTSVVLTAKNQTNVATLVVKTVGRTGLFQNTVTYGVSGHYMCTLMDVDTKTLMFSVFGNAIWFKGHPSAKNLALAKQIQAAKGFSDNMTLLVAHLADMFGRIAQPKDQPITHMTSSGMYTQPGSTGLMTVSQPSQPSQPRSAQDQDSQALARPVAPAAKPDSPYNPTTMKFPNTSGMEGDEDNMGSMGSMGDMGGMGHRDSMGGMGHRDSMDSMGDDDDETESE